METPGRKFKPEELERLGIPVNGNIDEGSQTRRGRPEGEVLLDDSSEESDEDVPEVSTRSNPGPRLAANPMLTVYRSPVTDQRGQGDRTTTTVARMSSTPVLLR